MHATTCQRTEDVTKVFGVEEAHGKAWYWSWRSEKELK